MRKIYSLLFFLGVILLAFWKVIFHEEFTLLNDADMCAQSFPWFQVASYWLKKGIFLLWDPYVYSGKATLGELQPGILYPLNWIFMLLPVEGGGINLGGMEALIILHYFLAAYFFYLLARSFNLSPIGAAVSGISFALGGFVARLYAFLNIFSSFTWMPLVILLVRKALLAKSWQLRLRWCFWSGLCLSLSFLAGHHVPPIHTGLLLFFYTIFLLVRDWKRTAWAAKASLFSTLVASGLIAALLSAVQLLPSLEWARRVYRWVGDADPIKWGENIPYSVLERTGNLNPQDVVSLVLPYVSTGANMYVGVIVLFLALIGFLFVRKSEARFFGFAAILYLFLCWGQFSVLHGWLNTFIPGIWFAREVYHYQVPFQVCLALLAGWGLDHLVESYAQSADKALRIFVRLAGWGIALLVLVSGVLMMVLNFQQRLPMNSPSERVLAGFAVYLCILGFSLFLLHTGRIRASSFGYLIITLVIVDLTSQVSYDIRTESRPRGQPSPSVQAYWKKPAAADFLQSRRKEEYFRVDDSAQIFPPNFGDAWLLEATMGHGATALINYLQFRDTGWGPGSNASALLNARYFSSQLPVSGAKKVFQGEGKDVVYLNPRAAPRAFVAARYRTFRAEGEVLNWIFNPMLSPRETVLLLEQDFEKLPESFRKSALDEHDRLIEVHQVSRRTAGEKEAEKITDEEMRHNLSVFQPPWGWSPGDEVEVVLRPQKPIPHCYLLVNYYPTRAETSRLGIAMKTAQRQLEIKAQLPGVQDGESIPGLPLQSAIDLGAMNDEEYRLSFIRTETCSARLDSLRIAASLPEPGDRDAGSVSIRSFKPNRIRLDAELKRPAFVVVSEIFYPGWEARVDGRPAPLMAGDYILRAVPVSEGKHEIELRYRPRTFFWGLAITLLTLTGMTLFLVFARLRALVSSR